MTVPFSPRPSEETDEEVRAWIESGRPRVVETGVTMEFPLHPLEEEKKERERLMERHAREIDALLALRTCACQSLPDGDSQPGELWPFSKRGLRVGHHPSCEHYVKPTTCRACACERDCDGNAHFIHSCERGKTTTPSDAPMHWLRYLNEDAACGKQNPHADPCSINPDVTTCAACKVVDGFKQKVVTLAIVAECDAIKAMLLAKNEAYGNSALDPVRIWSKASPREQILVRLDDKLSRVARGSAAGEDIVLDTIGYLVLLRVLDRMERP